jgi:hypothetical protein
MLTRIRAWDERLARAKGARANLLEDVEIPTRAERAKHVRLRRTR